MTYTDTRKMKDADIIAELSTISYHEFGLIEEDADPAQNRAQMLIDELEYRHVIQPHIANNKAKGQTSGAV